MSALQIVFLSLLAFAYLAFMAVLAWAIHYTKPTSTKHIDAADPSGKSKDAPAHAPPAREVKPMSAKWSDDNVGRAA